MVPVQSALLLVFAGKPHERGPLPADIQNITTFSIGLQASAPALDAAKALVKALSSPEARSLIAKAGMDPA